MGSWDMEAIESILSTWNTHQITTCQPRPEHTARTVGIARAMTHGGMGLI